MKLLVGIPVFRLPSLVRRCLLSLADTPATVLAIDNAADAPVKSVLREFDGRIVDIAVPRNEYCNGGWNRVLAYGLDHDFDVIVLGSSDATLMPGWYEASMKRVATGDKTVFVPSIDERAEDELSTGGLAGFIIFLPRAAADLVYPIPSTLRHWFGDQYMFEKLRANGWKTVVAHDVKATHAQSAVTAATPEAYAVIEGDKRAWAEMDR